MNCKKPLIELKESSVKQHIEEFKTSAKELPYETTVLVRQSKEKLIGHILTTEKSSELKTEIARPPNAFLTLEHIFGINTANKTNYIKYLHYDKKSEQDNKGDRTIIYYVSRYVVIEDLKDNLQTVYEGHVYKVVCYAVSSIIVASADTSGSIHFWRPNTRDLLKTMKLPFEGSVIERMDFSADGKLLLVITSPSQAFVILDWMQNREIAFKNVGDELKIIEAKFDPTNKEKIVAIGKGIIIEFDLTLGSISTTKYCSVTLGSHSILLCMDFLIYSLDDVKLQSDVYIGTNGGDIGVLINHQFEKLSSEPIHLGAINSIRVVKDMHSPGCIITAGDDNTVKFWDISLNLITSINVPGLDIYKNISKQYTGSGIPLTHLNGIHSIDVLNLDTNKWVILIGLRCGDTIEAEIETESYSAEKFLQENTITLKRIAKPVSKIILLSCHHSSANKNEEYKICVTPIADTSFLISSGDTSTLRLWDLSTNSLIWTEDLGMSRGLKVTYLASSQVDNLLVVGLKSGIVVYYKLTTEITDLVKIPRISLKYSTHDSVGSVLGISFSNDANLLAVSHGFTMSNDNKEVAAGVFIYTRNQIPLTGQKIPKETYVKTKRIEIPMSKSSKSKDSIYSPIAAEFSMDNKYLQLCYLPVTKAGRIVYEEEPICIVWDIERNAVAEDWNQLINLSWNDFAFSPSIFAKGFPEVRNITFSCMKFLGKEPSSLICAGSIAGDIHIFRCAALLMDKKNLIGVPGRKLIKDDKMALAKSKNSCCSYINSIHLIVRESKQWIVITGVDDEVILKYNITYEEYKWNLNYLLLDPKLIIEDPFQEFPTQEAFLALLNNEWKQRSSIKDGMIVKGTTEGLKDRRATLQVSWVFGRRAFDRRNNLKFDYLGRIVYPAGTMLLIANENIKHFASDSIHDKTKKRSIQQIILNSRSENSVYPEISCIAISKSKRLIGIGTAELQATIYAWDISTDTEIAICPILAASLICALKFHKDERHVVALALSNEHYQVILILDLLEGIELCRATQIHSLAFKIRDIDFYPGETYTNFVTCGIQHLSFWQKNAKYISEESANLSINPKATLHFANPDYENKLNENIANASQSIISPPQTNQCGALLICKDLVADDNGKIVYASFLGIGFIGYTMLTISDDGFVYIWEQKCIIRKRQGHSGAILCLDIHESDRLVVTGGVDGRVVLWSFNAKSAHGNTDLEKIRSIHLKSEGIERCVQSVAINAGILMVGTKTGSIYILNVADANGNIKPKQTDIEVLKPFLNGIDNERPQSVAYNPLNNRLCCLSQNGFFAVISVDTQLLIYSKNYSSKGLSVHILRITGNIILVFENEIIFLTDEYEQIPSMYLNKTNITTAKVSSNDSFLAVANMEGGNAKVTIYRITNTLNELHSKKEYKSAIVTIDFTADDNYLFISDELGEFFMYEIEYFQALKSTPMEVEIEWQSWGLRADPEFVAIEKNYPQSNKISALTRIRSKDNTIMIAVGDQSGTLKLYKYPMGLGEEYLTTKFEHLVWIRNCIATKEGNMLWTFAEGDKCVIRWKINFNEKQ